MAKRYAKVVAGVIENIGVANAPEDAPGCVEMDDVLDAEIGIGDLYDGVKFVKKPPPSPPEKTPEEIKAEARRQIEAERDAKLAEGALWNGKRWHMDDVMRSALQWRIMRWSMGRLAPDATLPVRAMDNTIHMLGRDEHMALAEAIEATGGAIYAESWAKKDAM